MRGVMCVLRSILGGCGFGRNGRSDKGRGLTRYPEFHAKASDEFLDVDVQLWLPMFIWWDREHRRRRSVPADHVDEGSIRRFAYVKTEIAAIERRKRAYYMGLAMNRNISEADAFRSIEEWYALKEHILDDEYTKHQAIEYDVYCQICLERHNDAIMVPCQHEICNGCFLKLPNRSECPFCRGVVEKVVLHEPPSDDVDSRI